MIARQKAPNLALRFCRIISAILIFASLLALQAAPVSAQAALSQAAPAQTQTVVDVKPPEFAQRFGVFFPLVTGFLTVLLLFFSLLTSKRALDLSKQIADKTVEMQKQLAAEATKQQKQIAEESAKQQKRAMEGNVLLISNERYSKVWELFWELQHRGDPKPSATEVEMLYRRYWGLQHDQYQYFHEGLVSEDRFRYWLQARYLDYRRSSVSIGNIDFKKGWDAVRNSSEIPDDVFKDVMNIAMDVKGSNVPQQQALDDAMNHYRAHAKKP